MPKWLWLQRSSTTNGKWFECGSATRGRRWRIPSRNWSACHLDEARCRSSAPSCLLDVGGSMWRSVSSTTSVATCSLETKYLVFEKWSRPHGQSLLFLIPFLSSSKSPFFNFSSVLWEMLLQSRFLGDAALLEVTKPNKKENTPERRYVIYFFRQYTVQVFKIVIFF